MKASQNEEERYDIEFYKSTLHVDGEVKAALKGNEGELVTYIRPSSISKSSISKIVDVVIIWKYFCLDPRACHRNVNYEYVYVSTFGLKSSLIKMIDLRLVLLNLSRWEDYDYSCPSNVKKALFIS